MAFDSTQAAHVDGSWSTIAALIAADGSATHPAPRALASPGSDLRDLADAVHGMCMLHGRHPGAIDHAVAGNADPVAEAWLTEAAGAFATERGYLAQLTAAAGPLPPPPARPNPKPRSSRRATRSTCWHSPAVPGARSAPRSR